MAFAKVNEKEAILQDLISGDMQAILKGFGHRTGKSFLSRVGFLFLRFGGSMVAETEEIDRTICLKPSRRNACMEHLEPHTAPSVQ